MAEVMRWENAAIVVAECPLDLYRSNRGDTALTVFPMCVICLSPFEGCSEVDKERIFEWEPIIGNWIFNNLDPTDETRLRAALIATSLPYSVEAGCHWKGSQSEGGGNDYIDVEIDLTITDDSAPDQVSLSLDVKIDAEIDGKGDGWTTITYTLNDVDPRETNPVTLTTTADLATRTYTFDTGEELIFPTTVKLGVEV